MDFIFQTTHCLKFLNLIMLLSWTRNYHPVLCIKLCLVTNILLIPNSTHSFYDFSEANYNKVDHFYCLKTMEKSFQT